MALQDITKVVVDNAVTTANNPTFYIEKGGAFKRVSAAKMKELLGVNDSGGGSSSDHEPVDGSDVFVVPLTFHAGGEEDVTQNEDYKGEWDSATEYGEGDIVKHVSYIDNVAIENYDNYKGVYDPTVSYGEGDVVYAEEDMTQKDGYKGEWDSATTYNQNDIVFYDNGYWVCYEETSTGDEPSNYNEWGGLNQPNGYFASQSLSNLGNNPLTDDGTFWEEIYYDSYGPHDGGRECLKGEWDSLVSYQRNDIVWKIDSKNVKIYYGAYEPSTGIDPELPMGEHGLEPDGDRYYWNIIGPEKIERYYRSIVLSNQGNDPAKDDSTNWEIYTPETFVDRYTSDVTYKDIKDALVDGKMVIGVYGNEVDGSDEFTGRVFLLTDLKVAQKDGGSFLSVSFAYEGSEKEVFTGEEAYDSQSSNTIEITRENVPNPSVLIIPLTYHWGDYEVVTEKSNYRGTYDSETEYEYNDIVSVEKYEGDVGGYENFKGVYVPQTTYNENDVVVVIEDVEANYPEYKGTWDSSVAYYYDEIVSFNGKYYRCYMDADAGIYPTNDEYWGVFIPSNTFYKSLVSDNTANDPKTESEYWTEFEYSDNLPYYNMENRMKGEWDSSVYYEYGDIVWILDSNNVKIYFRAYGSENENPLSEDSEWAWERIGPSKNTIYYYSWEDGNIGHNPEEDSDWWNGYEAQYIEEHYTSTATINDIHSAVKAGKMVLAKYSRNYAEEHGDYYYSDHFFTLVYSENTPDEVGDRAHIRFLSTEGSGWKVEILDSYNYYYSSNSMNEGLYFHIIRDEESDDDSGDDSGDDSDTTEVTQEQRVFFAIYGNPVENVTENEHFVGEFDNTATYNEGDIVLYYPDQWDFNIEAYYRRTSAIPDPEDEAQVLESQDINVDTYWEQYSPQMLDRRIELENTSEELAAELVKSAIQKNMNCVLKVRAENGYEDDVDWNKDEIYYLADNYVRIQNGYQLYTTLTFKCYKEDKVKIITIETSGGCINQEVIIPYSSQTIESITESSEPIIKTSMIAPEYDSSETYAVGALVIQGGKLYKCINEISSPEDFESSNWDETTLAEVIASI